MIQKFIIKKNYPRLLLFFAGWGMDEQPFQSYHPHEKDFMIVYDYSSPEFDYSLITAYKEIEIVAWSMGVWAVSSLLDKQQLPVTKSLAINGTPFPVHDTKGIPVTIFEGTLQHLNEVTLYKFQRRMCGNKETFNNYLSGLPRRDIESLREELITIKSLSLTLSSHWQWDEVYIGTHDAIFPPENQQQAWKETQVHLLPYPHYCEALWAKVFI